MEGPRRLNPQAPQSLPLPAQARGAPYQCEAREKTSHRGNLPAGVERFDLRTTRCETRDPLDRGIFGGNTADSSPRHRRSSASSEPSALSFSAALALSGGREILERDRDASDAALNKESKRLSAVNIVW